jgi:hypothetical protein
MLFGFITAAVGAMDWSPLFNFDIDTGLSKNHLIWIGGTTFAKGVVDEVARRSRATELDRYN